MSTWVVRTEKERELAIQAIRSRKAPFSMSVSNGAPRSIEQNKLQRMWMIEAQLQGDQTAEEYRGFCKLNFGVPILRAENERFCEVYDRLIRPRTYAEKIELMMAPIDLPVTRIMTSKQKTAYLDKIYNHFSGIGYQLTQPNR